MVTPEIEPTRSCSSRLAEDMQAQAPPGDSSAYLSPTHLSQKVTVGLPLASRGALWRGNMPASR